jgi:hypothetical protein
MAGRARKLASAWTHRVCVAMSVACVLVLTFSLLPAFADDAASPTSAEAVTTTESVATTEAAVSTAEAATEPASTEAATSSEAAGSDEPVASVASTQDDSGMTAQATSGANVYMIDGTTGVETDTSYPASSIAISASAWSNTAYESVFGGLAISESTELSGITLNAGTLRKYLYTHGGSTSTPQTLTFSASSKISSGTATTSFENLDLHLSASSITADAGGTVSFKDCTITLDSSSSLVNNGTMTFENCKIVYADGSSAISSSGTLSLTGCTVDGGSAKTTSVTRASAAITITNGSCVVTDTDISNVSNTNSSSGGGAFRVDGGTLTLVSGTISKCLSASSNFAGGGAVAYVKGGEVHLAGATITGCGVTDPPQYSAGPFHLDGGSMTMSGGTITNCKSSHGGAVCITSSTSKLTMTGGTISNNSVYYDGGGIFVYASGTVEVSGGSITGNVAGRNGAAIGTRGGTKVVISGGSITGNNTTGETQPTYATPGAVSGFGAGDRAASITLSGNPTISGNTYGTGTSAVAADLAVYDTTSLIVGNLASTASVGITSPTTSLLAQGAQFATASSAGVMGSYTLFNDADSTLIGSMGTGTAVKWAKNSYVCKIVDTSTGVATGYDTLQAAIDAIPTNGTATIQMLVENYEFSSVNTVAAGKDVTITKAAEDATDGLPYRGTTGSTPTLSRTVATVRGFAVTDGATLTLDGLTLTGTGKVNGGGSNGESALVYVNGATANLQDTTVTGANSKQGSAVCLKGGASMTMKGTSAITNSVGTDAGVVDIADNSTLTMCDHSSISGNVGTNTSSAIFFRSAGAAGSKLVMQDHASITNNTCTATGAESATICSHSNMGSIYMSGDSSIAGNTSTTASGGAGAIRLVGSKDVLSMTGNASISDNSVSDTRALAGGVHLLGGASLTMDGSSSITGNTCTGTSGAGVYLENAGTVTVSGDARVTGNTNGSGSRNLWVPTTTSLVVGGDLTSNADVGVYCTDHMKQTNPFAITQATTATSVSGLYHLTNDDDAALYGMARDTSTNVVVWGKGTCQIIRAGAFVDTYDSLADACAAAQTGDVIQVFRSHELTECATLPSGVTDVTIETAPLTQTVTGAFSFLPSGDETTSATITRASTYTDGALLDITTTGDTVSGLTFDGGSVSATAPAVRLSQDATMTDVTVRNCVDTADSGAVEVADGHQLAVSGKVVVTGNLDGSGNPSNIVLRTANTTSKAGVIKVVGSLDDASRMGVTVIAAEHVSYVPFARGYEADGTTESTSVAEAARTHFYDDRQPGLNIGANALDGHADLSTYIYFKPPTAFSFYKTSDNLELDPISGVRFRMYQWTGTEAEYESWESFSTYLDDDALAADTQHWKVVAVDAAGDTIATSDANGLVDFGDPLAGGGVPDGVLRLVELDQPANHVDIREVGGWHFVFDSTAADPNKASIPTNWTEPLYATGQSSGVYAPEHIQAADGTWSWRIRNAYDTGDGQLKVYKNVTGAYGDKTQPFTFTIRLSVSATAQVHAADGTTVGGPISLTAYSDASFTLSDGQYLQVDGLAIGTTYKVSETAFDGYTTSVTTTVQGSDPTTATSLSATGTTVQGETRVDFTNDKVAPVTSGVDGMGTGWVIVMIALVALGVMACLARRRMGRAEHRR